MSGAVNPATLPSERTTITEVSEPTCQNYFLNHECLASSKRPGETERETVMMTQSFLSLRRRRARRLNRVDDRRRITVDVRNKNTCEDEKRRMT